MELLPSPVFAPVMETDSPRTDRRERIEGMTRFIEGLENGGRITGPPRHPLKGLEDAKMMELLAALSGAGIVIGRMLNAQAGAHIGLIRSTFNNYWVGLACCAVALAFAGGRVEPPGGFDPVMHIGGALGVGVVMLSSLVALKVSTLRLTLVAFVSQMATALALDWAFSGIFSAPRAVGSLLVLAGLVVQSSRRDASVAEKSV